MLQFDHAKWSFILLLHCLVVATDDQMIAECCRGFGADVIMTSESCRNGNAMFCALFKSVAYIRNMQYIKMSLFPGTERCNEAFQKLDKYYDIVVNIQGDEPLIEPEIIDGIVKALQVNNFLFHLLVNSMHTISCFLNMF